MPLLVRQDVVQAGRQRRLQLALEVVSHLDPRHRHYHVNALGFLRLRLDLVVGSLSLFVATLDGGVVR
jgi:hypothetical protein